MQNGDIINIDVTVYLDVSLLASFINLQAHLLSLCTLKEQLALVTAYNMKHFVDSELYNNFRGLKLQQGYHGDTSKTFFCGDVDEGFKRLVKVEYDSPSSPCCLCRFAINGFCFNMLIDCCLVYCSVRLRKNAWRKVLPFVKMEQASRKSGRGSGSNQKPTII